MLYASDKAHFHCEFKLSEKVNPQLYHNKFSFGFSTFVVNIVDI